MFKEANYEVTEFSIAQNGMNQFISPDVLPSNFCYSLENIIPAPLGEGNVRFGTKLTHTLTDPPIQANELEIIRSFPFTLNGDVKQSILYVGYYVQDLSESNDTLLNRSSFSFESTNKYKYVKNTKIKILLTLEDFSDVYIYSEIKNVVYGVGDEITITIEDGAFPAEEPNSITIMEIWYQRGSIYSYNFNEDETQLEEDDLSIGCVPRCAYFQNVMMICNGVDQVKKWDGTILEDVYDFVVEVGASYFVRNNNNNFAFDVSEQFILGKYVIGGEIKLSVNGFSYELTISDIDQAGNVVSISTTQTLPAFALADAISLFYKDKPPAFSYIFIAKDRVWGLGVGAVSLEYRDINERLRVYYFYKTNTVSGSGIFNENLKVVPSYNLSDKHACQDNFEAICEVNGLLAFMGRKITQVYSVTSPGIGGDWSWVSNLNVGIFHGDLIVNLANDAYFVSSSGVNSFSTLNVAKQFSATSIDAVDTIVKKFTSDTSISNSTYRKCSSFKYSDGSICGFKILGNKIVASLFDTSFYSWFYLSGDFRTANCFMEFDKQFYMCIGNKIFKYADGSDGSPKLYGDQDNTSLVTILWTPGLIKFRGRKGYANKRYELVANYPSSFNLNDENSIEISVFGDAPKSFSLSDSCNFEYRGDLLDQEPIVENLSEPDVPGFRLRKEYEILNKRFKFVSSSFWMSISGYVMNGPITFRRIRLFGIGEKNA